MNMTNCEFKSDLKRFLEILPNKILDFSEDGTISEEDIYSIAKCLRDERKVPFYPRSIGPFKEYSVDIHYCIEILREVGFLDQIVPQSGANRKFSLRIYGWNDIDIEEIVYKKKILESCAIKTESGPMGNKEEISDIFSDFPNMKHSYLYTYLGSLGKKSGLNVGFGKIGIDSYQNLRSFEPKEKAGKREYEEGILSKIFQGILSHCDRSSSYSFRVSSLKKLAEEDKEEVKGTFVCFVGLFGTCERVPGNYLYQFRDSILLGTDHVINVFFGENGRFISRKLTLLERECLLLGLADFVREEIAIHAVGVINIDSESGVPNTAVIPRLTQSRQAELSSTIVGETNGSKTHVTGR